MMVILRTGLLVALCGLTIPAVTAAAEDDPKERGWEIFQQAREAVGAGADGVPLRDYVFELHTKAATPDGEVERRSKGLYLHPGLVRQEIDDPKAKIVVVFNGEKAWQVVPGDIHYMSDALAKRYKQELDRSHVLLLPPPPRDSIWFLKQEEVAGRQTDVIELREVGGPPLRLFVDVETHDVLKKMFVGDAPGGGMAQVEEYFSNFQDSGGYRWSFYKRVVRNGKVATDTTTLSLEVNTGLTESDIVR
jgi:outer membrane lipoprotein-sorting protein